MVLCMYSSLVLYTLVDFSRSCCGSLEGHESTVWSIAFEPPGGNRLGKILKLMYMYLIIGVVNVHDVDTRLYMCVHMHVHVASCGADKTIRIWKVYHPGNQAGTACIV